MRLHGTGFVYTAVLMMNMCLMLTIIFALQKLTTIELSFVSCSAQLAFSHKYVIHFCLLEICTLPGTDKGLSETNKTLSLKYVGNYLQPRDAQMAMNLLLVML